ncbi:MAG: homoserine kinase [Bacilli bacterium]|nr:homoserine kinase [Bacilli bacterium]
MRITITVPATSGNIGPGFDSLGLALNLYNQFSFELSNCWEFIGFSEKYQTDDNLVVKSMIKTYEIAKATVRPCRISLTQCIPVARGLGSSASCIVAGVVAANFYLNKYFNDSEILNIATAIEGHSDNVAPALYGSLICSYRQNKEVRFIKYSVNESLIFTAAIPNFTLPTVKARAALPSSMDYENIVYSLSRAINIPYVLKRGETEKLFYLLDDRLHQPYRLPLIKESQKFRHFSRQYKIPFWISGSGPTLMFVSKQNIVYLLESLPLDYKWQFITLSVNHEGTRVEEYK